jgi:hypothetical protein
MRTFFSLVALSPVVAILWTALSLSYSTGESLPEQPKQPKQSILPTSPSTPKQGEWKDPFAKPITPVEGEIVNNMKADVSVTVPETVSVQMLIFRIAFCAGGVVGTLFLVWLASTNVDTAKPINQIGKSLSWLVAAGLGVIAYVFVIIFAFNAAVVVGAVVMNMLMVRLAIWLANK